MSDTLSHVADSHTEPAVAVAGSKTKPWLGPLVMLLRIVLCLVFGLPLVFLIVSSFKPDNEIFADLGTINAFLPVGSLSLDNYSGVIDRVPFATFMMNSVLISVVTIALGLLVNSMAAFALSRMEFRGQKLILGVILATLIVPFETMALPLLWWVNQLPYFDGSIGWLDTYEVQIIPFVANAFSIYLFYQYFDSIPKELDEAAKVDGAGWFRIYRSIVMPLSGPAIATVAILTFLPAWNSYLWPLMVTQSEAIRPVMVGMDYFKQMTGSTGTAWGQIMAYASMITVPVLALFIAFQRAFINSIASSGVKG
ncbi:MAG: carbohydrate ABC transporter permease [Micropruina glycogenica]